MVIYIDLNNIPQIVNSIIQDIFILHKFFIKGTTKKEGSQFTAFCKINSEKGFILLHIFLKLYKLSVQDRKYKNQVFQHRLLIKRSDYTNRIKSDIFVMKQNAKSDVCQLKNELIPASKCIGAKTQKSWSTGKQSESQVNVVEGFVINSNKELRKQQTNLPKDRLEGVQGQLQMQFENDPYTYVGSGTLCIFGAGFENNKYFLLTCAHNVLSIHQGIETKINRATNITYYYSRESENQYFCSLIGESYTVHKGYEQKKDIWNGFDLALVKLRKDDKMNRKDAPLSKNSCWGDYLENSGAKVGSTIKVIGYPGEYKGNLYEMEGTIKEIRKFDDGHAIIVYNDINTSGGQSGSPIYLKTANNIWMIIGVHVGYDSSINCNLATAITKVVYDWIYECQEYM